MENIDDFTTCRSINVNSANSMKPCRKPLFQIMTNHFERKRRPDVCVAKNYKKYYYKIKYYI